MVHYCASLWTTMLLGSLLCFFVPFPTFYLSTKKLPHHFDSLITVPTTPFGFCSHW